MHSHGGHFQNLLLVTMLLVSCTGVAGSEARKRSSRPDYCDQQSRPSSFLWRINTSPPSYFFGTIHVPYDRVWPHIPQNVKRAFQFSDAVFFELALTEPATVSALTQCQLLPRGARLDQLIPRDIYRRLRNHLSYVRRQMPQWLTAAQRGRGLYADYLFNAITGNWRQKRPVWVMLMVNSLTEGDVRSRGVPVLDLYLAMEAEKMKKRTGAVERVQEQCLPLNRLETEQVVYALNRTLSEQEKIRAGQPPPPFSTDDLIKHYNCGDLDEVIFRRDSSQIPVAPLQPSLSVSASPDTDTNTDTDTDTDTDTNTDLGRDIDQYFRHELIYKRNQRMGERILELLLAHPHTSFFFAFGAGHFLGNFTVIEVLQEAGYKVTKVEPTERIPRFNGRKNSDEEMDFSGFPPVAGRPVGVHGGLSDSSDIFPSDGAAIFESARGSESSSKEYLNNFSDLWVRIEDKVKRRQEAAAAAGAGAAAAAAAAEDPSQDAAAEDSVRLWFGLPADRRGAGSAGAPLSPSSALLTALLLLVAALSPPRTAGCSSVHIRI